MISIAHAQQATAAGSGWSSIVMMVAIFAIFYFLMIRPQQKKQKELRAMISTLQKGDEILTSGGVVGRISNLSDNYMDLEVADNTVIKMQRNAIVSVLPKGSLKSIK